MGAQEGRMGSIVPIGEIRSKIHQKTGTQKLTEITNYTPNDYSPEPMSRPDFQ